MLDAPVCSSYESANSSSLSGEQIDAEPCVTVREPAARYFGGGGFGMEA
jgi:hypothetical protein